MAFKDKFSFSSPVTIGYAMLCIIVLMVDSFIPICQTHFSIPGTFNWGNPTFYFRLFGHVAGHANWDHLMGNMMFLIPFGVILEEKYSSRTLLLLIVITAPLSGILHIAFATNGSLGASGIVFMFIILGSVVGKTDKRIPVELLLICFMYLGKEVMAAFKPDNVTQLGHIIGGLLGGGLGLLLNGSDDEPETDLKSLIS